MTAPKPVVIFDLDGTLIDSAPDIHAVANRVFGQEGLPPLPFDQVRSFIGNGVSVLIERCIAAHALSADPARIADLSAIFAHEYQDAVHLTTLYPGVKSSLQHIVDKGYSIAICTNKPTAPTQAVLRHFGLLQLFDVIVGGDTLSTRKPDPAPLEWAKTQLGGGAAIFVGDSEVDAQTASAAELPFWLYTKGYRKSAAQALGAAWIFEDYRGLCTHLMTWRAPSKVLPEAATRHS